jgi:transcriptional regulator with XRE-family HTH domain
MNDKKEIGERLKSLREKRGLSKYRVVKNGGLNDIRLVDVVENGDTAYTIDSLLKYLNGCELEVFFSDKK